jgi:hypothetical protein
LRSILASAKAWKFSGAPVRFDLLQAIPLRFRLRFGVQNFARRLTHDFRASIAPEGN